MNAMRVVLSAPINPSKWLTLAASCLGLAMLTIDSFVVNVAFPAIGRDLHADSSAAHWTASGRELRRAAPAERARPPRGDSPPSLILWCTSGSQPCLRRQRAAHGSRRPGTPSPEPTVQSEHVQVCGRAPIEE